MYQAPLNHKDHSKAIMQQAKNALFDAEFQAEVERQLAIKRGQSGMTLAEKTGASKQDEFLHSTKVKTFEDENKAWTTLMKDCCYYYDHPTLNQEKQMRYNLQLNYDHILPAGWRPQLQSRKDLVTWACKNYEGYFNKQSEEEVSLDCENTYYHWLSNYGPNYEPLRSKLGHVKGLFD